jgi:hypothetical protein
MRIGTPKCLKYKGFIIAAVPLSTQNRRGAAVSNTYGPIKTDLTLRQKQLAIQIDGKMVIMPAAKSVADCSVSQAVWI